MAPTSTTTRSKRGGLVAAVLTLDWFDRVVLGKARRGTKVPSVLVEDGFIRALLREARLLKKEVGLVMGSREFRRDLLRASGIDWRGASANERSKAVTEMTNLIRGMPSEFAPGVKIVLDEQGRLVVDDAHRSLGKKFTQLRVDPVFSLRNEEAISAISDTTSIFFPSEYERQATRFRRRAQDTIASGLSDGLGRREISTQLRREFAETALHEEYWETVAAVHVNRARSFSSASTYASNGVTKYEVVAVGDERTTQICLMMDGKILSVESALGSFDEFEDADSMTAVKERVMPFMRVRGDEIVLPSGVRTATIGPRGGFSNTLTGAQLNSNAVNMPPYHYRCRTTVVPVFDEAPPSSKPIPSPPEPPKPSKRPAGRKKPRKPKRTIDAVEAASTPLGRRRAILTQIEDGRGFVPGALSGTGALHGKVPPSLPIRASSSRRAARNKEIDKILAAKSSFNAKLAEAFKKKGQAIIARNPKVLELWNKAIKDEGLSSFRSRSDALRALLQEVRGVGAEVIPEKQREKRKEKFLKALEKKASKGRDVGGTFKKKTRGSKLRRSELEDLRKWGEEAFNAWGPLAEEGLKRNDRVYSMPLSDRMHNSASGKYFGYNKRKNFHHELGHSIEGHTLKPRKKGERVNSTARDDQSYWAGRVKSRDKGPSKRLDSIFRGAGYDDWEKTREDKWGHAYMGKTYDRGSTEVLTMLSEAFGGNLDLWNTQFKKDPDVILEFLGYLQAVSEGEVTRQARLRKKS